MVTLNVIQVYSYPWRKDHNNQQLIVMLHLLVMAYPIIMITFLQPFFVLNISNI